MTVSQRDRAYQYIREKLINGLMTPGARLSNRALANEIGISFIPVREAISQLVSEGLVIHEPKLGSFVKQLSRQELIDLYDLREALEGHACRKAAECITTDQLAKMQFYVDKMQEILDELTAETFGDFNDTYGDYWKTNDAQFHISLLIAAGNRLALKTVSDLRVLTQVFGMRNDLSLRKEFLTLERLQRTCDEHQQIIDALRERNGETARDLMVLHIRSACERQV